MNKELAPTTSHDHDWVIDELGFAAILRREDIGRDVAGIIGGPRVNPTRSGLWIEDSFPAAIDEITLALLDDFVRRERYADPFATLDDADEDFAAGNAISRSARAPTRRPARVLCIL